jgi:hypothetical protein
MNAKERVVAALRLGGPDRTPRSLWWSPAVELRRPAELASLLSDFPMDLVEYREIDDLYTPGLSREQVASRYPAFCAEHLDAAPPAAGLYADEWGSIWRVPEGGDSGQVREPVLADITRLDQLSIPWEALKGTDLGRVSQLCRTSDKFVLSGLCAHPFEKMQFIRGTSALYLDLLESRDAVLTLRNMVHRFTLESIRLWLDAGVDGVKLMDDWGWQGGLLISPSLWRELFKPLYKEYCDLIHGEGRYVFFHSDGNIQDIIGDLVEVGVDALNSQLFLMDIEELGREFRGKVTFWGEIDRQHVLHSGDVSKVASAVQRVRRALEHPAGGAIAQCKWEGDHPPRNIRAVFEAWRDREEDAICASSQDQ